MRVIESVDEFHDIIQKGVVLVDFFAKWCGPCRMMEPVLSRLEKDMQDITIVKVNVDSLPQLAIDYGVRGIPTLIIFKDGEEKDRIIGLVGFDILKQRLTDLMQGV